MKVWAISLGFYQLCDGRVFIYASEEMNSVHGNSQIIQPSASQCCALRRKNKQGRLEFGTSPTHPRVG
jgi:hypothetical protein